MLINIATGTLRLYPSLYPETLAITVDNGGYYGKVRDTCGVFSGHHPPNWDQEGIRQRNITPFMDEDTGFRTYCIEPPEPRATLAQSLRFHYLATTWDSGVYVSHERHYEITLIESVSQWDIHIVGQGNNVTVALHDFQPVYMGPIG